MDRRATPCSSASTSARASTTPSAWTRPASGCTTSALPNNEPQAARACSTRSAKHGPVLVVVDQPAIDRRAGGRRRPRPGPSTWPTCPGWRCAASRTCYPGNAKTDARDALRHRRRRPRHAAHAAPGRHRRRHPGRARGPGRLRRRPRRRGDPADQPDPRPAAPASTPALERVLGRRFSHPAVLETAVPLRWPGRASASREPPAARLRSRPTRAADGDSWSTTILAALDEQTVDRARHPRRRNRAAPAGRPYVTTVLAATREPSPSDLEEMP